MYINVLCKITETGKSLELFEKNIKHSYFTYCSLLSNSEKKLKIYQQLTKLPPAMQGLTFYWPTQSKLTCLQFDGRKCSLTDGTLRRGRVLVYRWAWLDSGFVDDGPTSRVTAAGGMTEPRQLDWGSGVATGRVTARRARVEVTPRPSSIRSAARGTAELEH